MPSSARALVRTHLTALRALLVFTIVLGLFYPALILLAAAAFPAQAGGSLVRHEGRVVGSALLAQSFADADGVALPEYFQPRPSAGGWDAMASGGSNLGPENPELSAAIAERREDGATTADAVTSSGSGLDPHISVENARSQIDRVADARGVPALVVSELVESRIQARDLGFLGDERVNVLELNLALDALD